MKLRIWREKLSLALHIVRIKEDSLANRIWKEQKQYGWPGLAAEIKRITEVLGIEDVNKTELTKSAFRMQVTEACHRLNEERLREEMEGKRKCQKILADGYGRKEYFNKKNTSTSQDVLLNKDGYAGHSWKLFEGQTIPEDRLALSVWPSGGAGTPPPPLPFVRRHPVKI